MFVCTVYVPQINIPFGIQFLLTLHILFVFFLHTFSLSHYPIEYFLVGFRICRGYVTTDSALAERCRVMSEKLFLLLNKQLHLYFKVYTLNSIYKNSVSYLPILI